MSVRRATGYRLIQRHYAKCVAASITGAATYSVGASATQAQTTVGQSPMVVYLDAGIYALRIGATCAVNDTGPGTTLTLGLYPLGTPAGGANVFNTAFGTVVTGSNTIAYASPLANSTSVETVTADFASPGAAWYCMGVAAAGAMTANSVANIAYRLEARTA